MKNISVNSVSLENDGNQVVIENERVEINQIKLTYRETRFFSYLTIVTPNQVYRLKGLKSLWEHLNISTYDISDKCDDNTVFHLYWRLNYHLEEKSESRRK
jgi:hypothetical protein